METIDDNEYIIIPNPIYDVVFKYLMEDLESAKIVISTFLDAKIKKIELEPTSKSEKKDNTQIKDPTTKDDIRLFHLDFIATIELADGSEELVMIELQKASEPEDIFRFKRYISKNFQKKQEREIIDPMTQSVIQINKPIKLIPIFILNFRIENEINDLLIRTNRIRTGVFKNKELEKENEFIDNLTYDLWVVQIPNLNNIKEEEYKDDEYKNKLYSLLKLFDQKSKINNNEHRLRLIRKLFPDFLDRVIKRLQSADITNPNLEEQMYAEDEYLKALIQRDNKIGVMAEILGKKEKAIEQKSKELEQKGKELEQKDEIITHFAKMLKDAGVSIEEIQKQTNLSIDKIQNL